MRKQSTPRVGATLTEVLMALLIMSVGVVSVFSLFPISILSSIKANQLTNGKILADNAVDLVRTKPELVLGAKFWEPNTSYMANEVVCPRPASGSLYPDNNLLFRSSGGTSGAVEPSWPASGTVNDNGVTWTLVTPASVRQSYVVDELARAIVESGYEVELGNNGTPPSPLPSGNGVTRVNLQQRLGLATRDTSDFSLPDSWTVAFEAVPTGVTATSVTFSNIDLSGVNSNFRVVLGSTDFKNWATRSVQNAGTNTINLTGGNLPGNLDSAGEVGIARVEFRTNRYTWLTSVNRAANGQTRAQLVVVFNRSFSIDDERAYSYSGLTTDRTQATVTWGASPVPLIREGNYVLDVGSNRWHKIISPAESSGDTIVVEPAIEGTSTTGSFVFLPGVIGVYEL